MLNYMNYGACIWQRFHHLHISLFESAYFVWVDLKAEVVCNPLWHCFISDEIARSVKNVCISQ